MTNNTMSIDRRTYKEALRCFSDMTADEIEQAAWEDFHVVTCDGLKIEHVVSISLGDCSIVFVPDCAYKHMPDSRSCLCYGNGSHLSVYVQLDWMLVYCGDKLLTCASSWRYTSVCNTILGVDSFEHPDAFAVFKTMMRHVDPMVIRNDESTQCVADKESGSASILTLGAQGYSTNIVYDANTGIFTYLEKSPDSMMTITSDDPIHVAMLCNHFWRPKPSMSSETRPQ
jgi:hypothetical protein